MPGGTLRNLHGFNSEFELKVAVEKLWRENATFEEIGRALRYEGSVANRITKFRMRGWNLPHRLRYTPTDELESVVATFTTMTRKETAVKLGLTENQVRTLVRQAREAGIELPSKSGKPLEIESLYNYDSEQDLCFAVEQMWADGLSLLDIAEVLEVLPSSIGPLFSKWRRKGWKLPYRQVQKPHEPVH